MRSADLLGGHAQDLAVGLAHHHALFDRAPVARFVGHGSAEALPGERLDLAAHRHLLGRHLPLAGIEPLLEDMQEDDAGLALLGQGQRVGEGSGRFRG